MRRNTLIAIGVAVLVTACCGHPEHNHGHHGHEHEEAEHHEHAGEIILAHGQAEEAGLETEIVKKTPFHAVIRTGGHIQALVGNDRVVVAVSSGIVSFENPSLAQGMMVHGGQRLMSVSASTLQDGDPAMKAKLNFEAAEKEYKRAKLLVVDKIVSEKEYEQIRVNYETAKAAYQGQAGSITEKGVAVSSPITGYVKALHVSQGAYVTAGQPILTVSQNNSLQLRAEVPERYFKSLKDIYSANFKPSYEDRVYRLEDYHGRVLSCGKSTDEISTCIPVTFEFDNVEDFIPGAYTEIYLLARSAEDAFTVPMVSLTEEAGHYFVFVKVHEDAFKKREVTIGQNDGTRVEIISGLSEGEEVVTNGAYQVKLASASNAIPAHSHNH